MVFEADMIFSSAYQGTILRIPKRMRRTSPSESKTAQVSSESMASVKRRGVAGIGCSYNERMCGCAARLSAAIEHGLEKGVGA